LNGRGPRGELQQGAEERNAGHAVGEDVVQPQQHSDLAIG
jgi:hypothetical protein